MSDEADHADDAERAQARALAEALEGRAGEAAPPEDALEAALLLRHAGPRGELDPLRSEAILRGLLREGEPVRHPRRHALASMALGFLAAAVVALAFFGVAALRAPNAGNTAPLVTARRLPAPSASLLAAQSALARPTPSDAARFEREMRAYRAELWKTLEASYPAPLSALEPVPRRQP